MAVIVAIWLVLTDAVGPDLTRAGSRGSQRGGAGGQASDIRIEAEEILKVREKLNALISAETGQDLERVSTDSDRNFWMDAEQAKEYGLIGQVVTSASQIR